MKSSLKACLNLIIMKNRINFSHLSILITTILLLLSSCEKNNNSACVDCYNNVIRCKINGVDWKPYCEGDLVFGCTPYKIQYYEDTKWFGYSCSNKLDEKSFSIYIENLSVTDTNYISDSGYYDGFHINTVYKLKYGNKSYLKVIELNTSKRIIKAVFSIEFNTLKDSILQISDGFIDINY